MQLGRVVGNAVATIKHASMQGWRLSVIQPIKGDEKPDGEPLLAIDSLGADRGSVVMICNDGKGTRALVGRPDSPVRWFVMGIVD